MTVCLKERKPSVISDNGNRCLPVDVKGEPASVHETFLGFPRTGCLSKYSVSVKL